MSGLEQLIKDLNKKYSDNIAKMGIEEKEVGRIPFSSPSLNRMTYGGIPRNRFIEIFGPDNCGKSTLTLDLISNYQKLDDSKTVLYVDYEKTFDAVWAKTMGVDVDKVLLIQPEVESGEDVFDIIFQATETNEIGLVILDSIASLVPKQIKGESTEKQQMGGISKALTRFTNDYCSLLTKYNCTFIGLNQVREDMDNMWNEFVTTGGRAWKHGCSMRISLRKGKFIDDNRNELTSRAENPSGHYINAFLEKSKVCPSNRRNGYATLFFLTGIDTIGDTVEAAMMLGLIQGKGWYNLVDYETGELIEGKKFQGKANLIKYFKENQEDYELLWKEVNKRITV